MNKPKLKDYKKIVETVFGLFAANYKEPPKTADKWHEILMEAERLNGEYVGTPLEMFSVRFFSLLLNELEELSKTDGLQEAIRETEGAKTNGH